MTSKNSRLDVDFDSAPDLMLVDIGTAGVLIDRSRASIYRHIAAGELTAVKVGHSTRLRLGELRKLTGAVREVGHA